MKTSIYFLVLILLATSSTYSQQERKLGLNSSSTSPNRRMALVIGNGAYTNAPLKNPPNDATDMSVALSNVGFTVEHGVDLTQRQMKAMIREFGKKLKGGGQGLFYFAGHGVQLRGRNYLIPVDAEIASEADVEDQGVDVNLVMGLMDEAGNGLNVVILDACRNNPFARSFRSTSNGLAQVDAPTGTLVAYSTAPGRVARDGAGRNGAYTAELLKQMAVPGLPIEELLKRVRANLKQKTNGEQVPWESSSLIGDFYLNRSASTSSASISPTNAAPRVTTLDPAAIELAFWDTIKGSSDPEDIKNYLAKYPNGHFADLAKTRLNNLTQPAKPDVSKGPAVIPSRSYSALMAGAGEAVTSGNYIEADRLFNEAALAEPTNPEPYELLGKLYWEKAFSADGSDLNRAEGAYGEAIKRGGKAVIRIKRVTNSVGSESWPEITITITATKAVFAERQGEYTYETDYKGVSAEAGGDYSLLSIYYPKESGRFFKSTGKGKPNTWYLNFFALTALAEDRRSIYQKQKLYKLPDDERHARLRAKALVNILNAAKDLAPQAK